MSTLGESDHQGELARAGETQAATARTPRKRGDRNELEADHWRTTAQMQATAGGALWRTQPMTNQWAQWSPGNSEELLAWLEAANTCWSRGKPSFTVTANGEVTMSWGETQHAPLLVVDQFRGDRDDIEPPPHPDCTYTTLGKRWLRNLTVLCKAMPGVDIDAGFLHDYRKALRLCTVAASEIMHTKPPNNYHMKVAEWELAQEPQPEPNTQGQAIFEAHRARRLREAQRQHQSMEKNRRKAMMIHRKRARESEEQETSRQQEQTDCNMSLRGNRRPRVMQAGTGATAQPTDESTCHQCHRVLTFREEEARDRKLHFSVGTSKTDAAVHLERPVAAEEAERKAAQAGNDGSETDPKEVSGFRAPRLSEGKEPLLSDTRRESAETAASSGERIRMDKEPEVHLEQRDAAEEAEGRAATTGTAGSETEPKEVSGFRATRLSEEEGTLTTGTSTEGRRGTVSKANSADNGTRHTQAPRPRTAVRITEAEPLEAGWEAPAAKRSKSRTTAHWTVVPASDERGLADSMRRYQSATPTTAAMRAATKYRGPLLIGIDRASKELYPHIEPVAMESILQGLDDAVRNDRKLWQITTVEDWRRCAARGQLDHLGRTVAEKVGRYGGQLDWTRWKGPASTHMARTIMENTVQALKREHHQRHHQPCDRPHQGGDRAQETRGRNADHRTRDHVLAPTIRTESSKLAHQVAEEITRQLRNDACMVEANDRQAEDEGWTEAAPRATDADELGDGMTEEEEDTPQNADRWRLPKSLATLLESSIEAYWQGLSAKETKIVMREVEATIGEAAALLKLGNDKPAWRSQGARAMIGSRGALLRERLWAKRAFNVAENEHIMNRDEFQGQAIIDAAMEEWLRGGVMTSRAPEQEHAKEELDNQAEAEGWEVEAPSATANAELNDGMNEGEEYPSQNADSWRLPRPLATLLESSTEAFWPELSTKETKIVIREVEATIDEATALCRLGNDKLAWRSQDARAMIGTRGALLHDRLGRNRVFNGVEKEHIMNKDDFKGQAIIDAAVDEWLREDDLAYRPSEQEYATEMREGTLAELNPQLATENKESSAQLRRGRGCVGPLVREGNFTLQDGTQIQGCVQTSHRPESAVEQPEKWNQHMHICQRGCELLPTLTPPRVREQLRTGVAMSISFHVHGQDEAVGVLFMSPLELVRGAKLEGYNVDGVAVQEGKRGQGIGTLLLQVAKEEAMLAATKEGREVKKTALSITVQEQLQRWVYPQGFSKNVGGRSVSWSANSMSFYWRPDELNLDAAREWKWTARGMVNPDSLCQLLTIAQVLIGNNTFTTHLREATWPQWRAGDTLLRLMLRPRDPSIEAPIERSRDILDQRHHSRELITRLYFVLRGTGGEERKMSEQRDAQELLTELRAALDAEQAEQRPVFLQGTQPSWTEQLWGIETRTTRCCMDCQATRVMTTEREAELRLAASTENQLLEQQVRELLDTSEEMEANLCECGQQTRWKKRMEITSVGSLLWVHISRNNAANENARISGRMRCPKALSLRTSRGTVDLCLTGVVIHTGKPTVVTLPDGQHGETIAHGHYVANLHFRRGKQDWMCHLDDQAKPYEARHQDMYSSLDVIQTEGGGVESLALYQCIGPKPSASRGDETGQQLRLSLGGLGITALECQQRGPGGMRAKGSKHHDLEEPKCWIMPKEALISMQAGWRHALLNTTEGLAPGGLGKEELQRHLIAKERTLRQEKEGAGAIENILRELGGAMRNRKLWHDGGVHLIPEGHYHEPLGNATPMVAWFGGIHSLTAGPIENAMQEGITLLFFSGESLRLAGLGMTDASIDWTYESLMTQLRTLGGKNGIGVKCRITRLTADRPIVTWPGDWLAFVVGDLTSHDGEQCGSLIVTAWRPESPQRIQDAKEAFSNMRAEQAMHRLAQLGLPPPVRSTAAAWLQEGTTSWTKDELGFMAKLEARTKENGKARKVAPPGKDPKKRAAP